MAALMGPAGPMATAATPDDCLRAGRLTDLTLQIAAMPDGVTRDYFAGVVASRAARPDEGAARLSQALPALRLTRGPRLAEALYDLTYDDVLLGRYAGAAQAEAELNAPDLLATLDPVRRQDALDDAGIWRLLAGTPPMHVAVDGPTRAPLRRTLLGIDAVPVEAGGITADWIIDSGANLSVLTVSMAQRLGVAPFPETLHDRSGSTGLENTIRVGVVPRLRIGTAVVTDVPVLIFDDQALAIHMPKGTVVLNATIGYPVLRALGTVRLSRRFGFVAYETLTPRRRDSVALGVFGLMPTVSIAYAGTPVTGSLDSGANRTALGVSFAALIDRRGGDVSPTTRTTGGAGGTATSQGLRLRSATFRIGARDVTLRDLFVPSAASGAITDVMDGNFGQDLWDGLDGPVFDFDTGRFWLE